MLIRTIGGLQILLAFFSKPVLAAEVPTANTENGPVFGVYEEVCPSCGIIYEAFKGIPYAEPPIGELRFKEPQRLKSKWLGSWDARKFGSSCIQLDQFTRSRIANEFVYKIFGSEDCLFLNVFTPLGGTATPNKTVIFMIHGGAFMFGSGNFYGPQFAMKRTDVVYVSLNYRVGPMGFVTTGDRVIPGNNGLKDQAAALGWVSRNIAHFGGDPDKITIAGLSAGGASVDYMYLSPQTDGLFKRGYSFSGTSLCPWALVHDGVEKTKQLAQHIGCPITDSHIILKCLRSRPAEQIVEQVRKFLVWQYNPFTVFGPVIEVDSPNPYLDQHPREILKAGRGKDLPWVNGITSEESLYPAADFIGDEAFLRQFNARWEEIGKTLLFFYPKKHTIEEQIKLANVLKKAYVGDGPVNEENRKELLRLLSERLFFTGAVEAAQLRAAKNKQPVYLYLYGYQAATSVSHISFGRKQKMGTCHADDFIHVIKFEGLADYDILTEDDNKVGDILRDIFFSFETTGKIPDKYNWTPVPDDSSSVPYLYIKSTTDVKTTIDPLANYEYLESIFLEQDVSNTDQEKTENVHNAEL